MFQIKKTRRSDLSFFLSKKIRTEKFEAQNDKIRTAESHAKLPGSYKKKCVVGF